LKLAQVPEQSEFNHSGSLVAAGHLSTNLGSRLLPPKLAAGEPDAWRSGTPNVALMSCAASTVPLFVVSGDMGVAAAAIAIVV